MGRGQSTAAFNQSSAQSTQNQNNAQAALGKTNAAVGNYNNQLNNFLRFGRNTYGQNGEFMKDENALATQTAAAGSRAVSGDLAMRAMRTGENTAGYAAADAESRRQAEQALTGQLAKADSDRLQNLTAVNQYGVQASALPAQVYSSLYGSSLGAANSAEGNAVNAAKTPGFWDTLAPALVGGAATVGAGFTPNGGKGCWIAAAVYDGWDDPRTVVVRAWLNSEFTKKWIGRVIMAGYVRFGERIAEKVKRRRWLRTSFKRLFDLVLDQAIRDAVFPGNDLSRGSTAAAVAHAKQ